MGKFQCSKVSVVTKKLSTSTTPEMKKPSRFNISNLVCKSYGFSTRFRLEIPVVLLSLPIIIDTGRGVAMRGA